jgi:hypothetical protein
MRLARAEKVSPVTLSARLAFQTGYRLPTSGSVLRRACADGCVDSSTYLISGWHEATKKLQEELLRIGTKISGREQAGGRRSA